MEGIKLKVEPQDEQLNADAEFAKSEDEDRDPNSVALKPNPTQIEVKIKMEDGEDEFKHVSFTKSEDGTLDIWNLDGFELGPEITIEDLPKCGFTRKQIADAHGGGHQECFHHWYGDATLTKKSLDKGTPKMTPYVTFNREWNPQLPVAPGKHGIVFCDLQTFGDKAKVDKPIVLYAREGNNDWKQLGLYSSKRYGEITTKHLSLLPPSVVGVWVKGALNSGGWGKAWIEEANAEIEKKAEDSGEEPECIEYTEEGLTAALYDGRLVINFTVMKCVGYCRDWDDRCLYYKDHPKPAKNAMKKLQKKRKRASGKQVTPAKKVAKVEVGRAIVKEESEVADLEAEYVE